ncbi:MAG: hypothetical protein HXM15_00535 [Fusobacterium periodonticum]|nr:hypothetical protein [Fusobacterium periodonticum]
MDKVTIGHVETRFAEESFRDEVISKKTDGRYKTILLNGIWGSGKTTFIKNCEPKFKSKGWKISYLKIWEIKDDRSLLRIAFKKLHPKIHMLLSLLIVIMMIISVLITAEVNLGFETWYNNKTKENPIFAGIKICLMLAGLSVTIFQLTKAKSDSIYIFLFEFKLNFLNWLRRFFNWLKQSYPIRLLRRFFNWLKQSYLIRPLRGFFNWLKQSYLVRLVCGFFIWLKNFSKKEILVIDDFDRASTDRQLEAYKLFNVIHGQIPIVFVGDFDKIISNDNIDSKYLNKFVDKRIELPVGISSYNLSKKYSESLLNLGEFHYSEIYESLKLFLSEIFIKNNHSLRELYNFIELLNDELEKKGDSVQVDQFIVIVYLYELFPLHYGQLVKNYDRKKVSTSFDENNSHYDHLTEEQVTIIKRVLFNKKDTNISPLGFSADPETYFLNNNIPNLSSAVADSIYKKLIDNFEGENIENYTDTDFLRYLKRKKLDSQEIDKCAKVMIDRIDSDCIYILSKELYKIINSNLLREKLKGNPKPFPNPNSIIFKFWEEKLDKIPIDKKCHFLRKIKAHAIFYKNLGAEIKKYVNDNDKIRYPADVAYFIVGGLFSNIHRNSKDLKKVFKSMNSKEEMLDFLRYVGIYRSGHISTKFTGKDENGDERIIELDKHIKICIDEFPELEELKI